MILALGFSAALYGNFKDRTDQWKFAVKTSREYLDEEKMTVMILAKKIKKKIKKKNILTEKRKWS